MTTLRHIYGMMIQFPVKWIPGICLILLPLQKITMQNPLTIPIDLHENNTVTYEELITFYEALSEMYPTLFHLYKTGMTDSGNPLHVGVFNAKGVFHPDSNHQRGNTIWFINNAIHPGEPEGIDATMQFFRNCCQQKITPPDNITIVTILAYNIDGMLRRNSNTRANQDGPESYGFRGNARNLDLNRDFIKCDTRNALTFSQIFTEWQPHLFVDNHTSNGADYPYVMTLIATQKDKLPPPLSELQQKIMLPYLYKQMSDKGEPMVPYVFCDGPPDEKGIDGFLDLPRYSTGYAALHHTLGFMPETHMLKPFALRLQATYRFLECVYSFLVKYQTELQKAKLQSMQWYQEQNTIPIHWKHEPEKYEIIPFNGYAAKYKQSAVTNADRLYYDRNAPYEKMIPYRNQYLVDAQVKKPKAYIIPFAWKEVIERLEANHIQYEVMQEARTMEVHVYQINNIQSASKPYEGHYYHHQVQTTESIMQLEIPTGSYYIPVQQRGGRYLCETLEPGAPDSFFAWNFFDSILGQKEYYSDYVFEDLAAEYLAKNPDLKAQLEKAKKADPQLAANPEKQLDWVYQHGPWYEGTPGRYPIYRVF